MTCIVLTHGHYEHMSTTHTHACHSLQRALSLSRSRIQVIEMVFSKKRADDRKAWLLKYESDLYVDHK
jgi:hypothetical protein